MADRTRNEMICYETEGNSELLKVDLRIVVLNEPSQITTHLYLGMLLFKILAEHTSAFGSIRMKG